MIANNFQRAKEYGKPIVIAKSFDTNETLYWVPDSTLPAVNLVGCDPLNYLERTTLWEIKKKYRVPKKVWDKIVQCYKQNLDKFNLGKEATLESRLLISEIEKKILDKLKREYRSPSASFFPAYDPLSDTGRESRNTAVIGCSGAGKTTIVCKIIAQNFHEYNRIWVFSPTASSDPAYQALQEELGKTKVRLINSNDIDAPISLSALGKAAVLVVDDLCSTKPNAARWIAQVQSQALYEGRHLTNNKGHGMCTFSIYHDFFKQGKTSSVRSASIESSRIILFPHICKRLTTKVMKQRLLMTGKQIKQIYKFLVPEDRYICMYQHHPNCVVTPTGVKLL
mgnify:CR=1 FL=1|jgi:hypothetical protein